MGEMSETLGLRALRRERAYPKNILRMGVPPVHTATMDDKIREALSDGLEEKVSGFFNWVMARKKPSGTSAP